MSDTEANPRIFIVDDVPKNIQVVGTILRQADYQIYIAQNGLQAIEMATEIQPDLILLDIMMPGLDGLETCQRLKKIPETRDIPVIFLTAKAEEEDIVKGLEIGAVDYITKPFNASVLLARVRTHLILRRQSKQLQSLADKDGLTLLANRRRFDEFIDTEWRRNMRTGSALSMIMLDIDYFKLYNDTYGHLQGDEVLKQVANVLKSSAQRPGDMAARFGGEEFALVLNHLEYETAVELGNKILSQIEGLNIKHAATKVEGKQVVTASLGLSTMIPSHDNSVEDLIRSADEKLYQAKEAGRNQLK